jgi:hypothetical protein
MKTLFVIHFLWASLLAFCYSPDMNSDRFDIGLSIGCCVWVICAFGMFFRARWAWWGSLVILGAVTTIFSVGVVGALFDLAAGRALAAAKHWPGWGAMLGFYLPTVGLLAAVWLTKRFYGKQRPTATA